MNEQCLRKIENTLETGEIAYRVQKSSAAEASESVSMWERVNTYMLVY